MKILWKRGEIAPKEQFLPFSTIFCCLLVDLCIKTGTRFSLRVKRLFEISEFEITRVDCTLDCGLCTVCHDLFVIFCDCAVRKHAYLNTLKIFQPKKENFQIKNSDIFHISAQNIDCGYSLEPLLQGGYNECPQIIF